MAFGNEVITCGAAAAILLVGNRDGVAALVRNLDATDTVYLGASDVTADTTAATGGFPLAPDETVTIAGLHGQDTLYGVTTGGSALVSILYFDG